MTRRHSSTSCSATRCSASASRRSSARATSAPFAELAWLTTPTPTENDWLAAQGERFAELTTALSDPAYGSTGFFAWLDQRYDAGEPPDAALRMVHAGLMALPPGARLSERHRHDPSADDWVLLLEGWAAHLRTTGEDEAVLERIRAVLPSVGYQLTRRGIRRGRSPVDRVLARSEAKVAALTEIVEAEHRGLGERMRMLVLCDHEQATATLPADLDGVLSQEAGSARLALRHLEDALPDLHPVLVTGRTVAGSPETMKALAEYVATYDPDLASRVEQGRWTSREWVPWVTRFFEAGHCQVLVGTRGLLGEGWDARAVTGLVDLTTATTSTAVVQTRGRALRTDPGWPDKVALTWSVVCVSEDHPKGGNDWDRFVRKHEGFYGVDLEGDVVAGVAHVDAAFSPYVAPPVADFDAVNARMLARAEDRRDRPGRVGGRHAVHRHVRAHRPDHDAHAERTGDRAGAGGAAPRRPAAARRPAGAVAAAPRARRRSGAGGAGVPAQPHAGA